MQRNSFEECKANFMQARQANNQTDVAIWATELLYHDENLPHVWSDRGNALKHLGHHLDAILNYDRGLALEKKPMQRATLLNNKGGTYWDLYKKNEALKCLNEALELHPFPETYMTLGNIYKHEGDLTRAIELYRKGLEVNPQHADLHLVLGMALLKTKQLKEGWEHYEWRWKTTQLPRRQLSIPTWAGQDLNYKTILVYGEQGLGDHLQFVRYARVLGERYPNAKVIVETRPTLKRLFETMPLVYAVICFGEQLPKCDYAIPMVSLAGQLTPTYESIPEARNEFLIRPEDTQRWCSKFDESGIKGKRIGICWAGMARKNDPIMVAIDNIRSTALMQYEPLTLQGIFWISLQKGEPADQLKSPDTRPCKMVIGDFTDDMIDFYETCAAISALDLVITVDTSVAHAAASIGKPTWLLSRWDGCWRWFGDGLTNPWYPSMIQFAQHAPHDWSGVMAVVARELATFIKK